jgi:hypothetical protein
MPYFYKNNINLEEIPYTNKKLKKIVNVFQKQYTNMVGQGLGDFLRGSIYLTYICNVLNLDFDIDLHNHAISKFLNITDSSYNICYSNVSASKAIQKNLINTLDNYEGEIYYLYNNFTPLFDIENPKYNIIQKARKLIIPKIEPKLFVLNILDKKLEMSGLKQNTYAVIHIRCGDYFMNIKKNIDTEKHQISTKHVNDILDTLKKNLNPNKKYIIIGDSNKIKKYIANNFTNIIMFNSQITHLGEDQSNSEIPILDTLIDFNIMRFSNFIISFTAYGHGSGFSKYCATIYNIPFKQIILYPILIYI